MPTLEFKAGDKVYKTGYNQTTNDTIVYTDTVYTIKKVFEEKGIYGQEKFQVEEGYIFSSLCAQHVNA